jgi:hypothetical protein
VNYRIGRKDPEYEQAMREAKILFEAAIAKSAVKGRGRPANAPVPAAVAAVELDIEATDDVEPVIEAPVAAVAPVAPVALVAPVAPVAAAPAKPAAKVAKPAAKPAAKVAPKAAAKPAAKTTTAKGRGSASAATGTATPARPATRRRPMATADQG